MHPLLSGRPSCTACWSNASSVCEEKQLSYVGTVVVEFLGQQVWEPIWSAGIFTRLENEPE